MGKPFQFNVGSDLLSKGLRPTKKIPRNNGYLVTCMGAVGIRGVLSVIDSLQRINTEDIQDGFPFPQIFVFQNMIIVCGKSTIYEWVGGELIEKIKVPSGTTWTAVDFFNYVYMSNGKVAVIRDSQSFQYSISNTLPISTAICNFSGQVIIGSPGGMFVNIAGVEMLAYGGGIAGGVATVTFNVSDMTGYGGGIAGGNAAVSSNIVRFIAYGGGIAGGVATMLISSSYMVGYGGGIAGGSAAISSNIVRFSGYGGGVCGGNAEFEFALPSDSWKNYFAASTIDTPTNRIKYAKQMGYDYLGITGNYGDTASLKAAMTTQGVTGLKFYVIDPFYSTSTMALAPSVPGYSTLANFVWSDGGRNINPTYAYTQAQKDWYQSRVAWKSLDAWPNNLVTGWFWSIPQNIASVIWDFQQQSVITEIINKIISNMQTCEDNTLNFKCAGYMLDIATLDGDMHKISGGTQPQVTISAWTGTGSCLLHSGITHEFPTYRDGVAAFYKQFRVALLAAFPEAKWIVDPARIWAPPSWGYEEYVYQVSNRTDAAQLIPDLLMQEGWDTDFVDQPQTFNALQINADPLLSGLGLTKDMVGCHQRTKGLISEDNLMVAKAGINGAWYNWFLQFGYQNSTTTMPGFSAISDVYPRLKLTRCIPNWDNLAKSPLGSRSYIDIPGTAGIYQSTNSYASTDIVYSRHWKNQKKIYVVWNTHNGVLNLKQGEQIVTIKRTDGYFGEISGSAGDGTFDMNISGLSITLKNTVTIPYDTVYNQTKGIGYIITIL